MKIERMQVITLDHDRFRRDCAELFLRASRSFAPDMVVGIRTGGYRVAEAIASVYPIRLLPITRRRASTAKKNKNPFVTGLMRRLPYTVTDAARLVEHQLLTKKTPVPESVPTWEPDPEELDNLRAAMDRQPPERILVVDDAVDTGATMKAVASLLRKCTPQAAIRTAAVVVTTPNPVISPDFALYRDTLCRFPWSHDYKS